MRVRLPIILSACGMAFPLGCGSSKTAPPNGLVKPSSAAMAALEAEKFEIRDVVVTVTIPKDNPSRRRFADGASQLPPIKCHIDCSIDCQSNEKRTFHFGLEISAPYGGTNGALFASGTGQFQRADSGRFAAELQLKQSMPLELNDKASLSLLVHDYVKGIGQPVQADTVEGKVILQQEE